MSSNIKVIWPMGAELPKQSKLDRLWDDPNYFAEEKINGERGIIHVVGDGTIRLTTRSAGSNDPSHPIEITHRWPQIQSFGFNCLPAGTVLDSEIYSNMLRAEEVAGLLNYKSTIPPRDDVLRCAIFDCIYWGDTSLEAVPQHKRKAITHSVVSKLRSNYVETPILTYGDKRKLYEDIICSGGEGVILKHVNGKYVQGKKPANIWVKAKDKESFDCIITGFKPANEGKYRGLVGSVELSQYKLMSSDSSLDEYQLFVVCHASGIPDSMRKDMTKYPEKYLGRVAVVDAVERVPNSVTLKQPRIKSIRTEGSKDPKDCIIND